MRTCIFILTLSICELLHAQNIVPNWSFEDSVMCPSGPSQVTNASGWNGYGSPDYFNACATKPDFSVPHNWGGYQQAATGKAYCALGVSMAFITNGREFIRRVLPSPLTVGTKYFVSLKVNLSLSDTIRVNCASNNLGIEFSTAPINAVNNRPHIYTTQVITDTANWTHIGGSFVADSAYTYINIGNFFDDLNSTTQIMTQDTVCNSYYFIDDICVSSDSLDCPFTLETGQEEMADNNNFTLFPNPARQHATLVFDNPGHANHSLYIYDTQGRLVKTMNNITTDKLTITVRDLTAGLYFLQLHSKNHIRFKTKLSVE